MLKSSLFLSLRAVHRQVPEYCIEPTVEAHCHSHGRLHKVLLVVYRPFGITHCSIVSERTPQLFCYKEGANGANEHNQRFKSLTTMTFELCKFISIINAATEVL